MLRSRGLSFLVVALSAIAVYPLWRDGSLLESCWFSVVGLGCALTIVAAVHRRDVPAAAAWRLFALGIALNSLGTPVAMIFTPDAWPSAGDPFYLALYPALTIGLVISNKAEAGGLGRANAAGIETLILDHRAFPSRDEYDRADHRREWHG